MEREYRALYPELYRAHWWWRVREEILLTKIASLLAGVPRARILDVGCGAALFFDALDQFGEVEGVESDRTAAEQSGKWRGRVVVGELDGSFAPGAPYDLILILDVLEHMHNPEQALRRAGDMLASTGHILVTVPAFRWLWTAHDERNHHVTRYSATEMRRTIERAGLLPVESSYMFQSLVVPKLLVRIKEALISGSAALPTIPPRVFNDGLKAWFRAEYSVAGWLPFGGSVIAIAAVGEKRG